METLTKIAAKNLDGYLFTAYPLSRTVVQWLRHGSDNTGAGEAHENRPPYYVLAYIMRTR